MSKAALAHRRAGTSVLMIATDTGGLYSGYPTRDPDARPLLRVEVITPEIMAMTCRGAGALGAGGMTTKLEAATKTAAAGIHTVLFCGHDAAAIDAFGDGQLCGTLIPARGERQLARKMLLRHTPPSGGVLRIDDGAFDALVNRGAALLPGGVIVVEGDFNTDAMVDITCSKGHRRARAGAISLRRPRAHRRTTQQRHRWRAGFRQRCVGDPARQSGAVRCRGGDATLTGRHPYHKT